VDKACQRSVLKRIFVKPKVNHWSVFYSVSSSSSCFFFFPFESRNAFYGSQILFLFIGNQAMYWAIVFCFNLSDEGRFESDDTKLSDCTSLMALNYLELAD